MNFFSKSILDDCCTFQNNNLFLRSGLSKITQSTE